MPELFPYEEKALREIEDFKRRKATGIEKAISRSARTADKLLDTRLGELAKDSLQKILEILNDAASFTVRSASIYKRLGKRVGTTIYNGEDIQRQTLENVDRAAAYLRRRYTAAAVVEGIGTGAVGAAGLVADIPALTLMALRAANEYATYYGFDVSEPAERVYALQVLSAASANTVPAKAGALMELSHLSVLMSKGAAMHELERLTSYKMIRRGAELLGVRLTRAKLKQIVPLIGAGVGGGFNAWYMHQVTTTALTLYRERFLIAKHGPEIAVIPTELEEAAAAAAAAAPAAG